MNIDQDNHRKVRAELHATREPVYTPAQIKEPMTHKESQYANKSPGPDEISN